MRAHSKPAAPRSWCCIILLKVFLSDRSVFDTIYSIDLSTWLISRGVWFWPLREQIVICPLQSEWRQFGCYEAPFTDGNKTGKHHTLSPNWLVKKKKWTFPMNRAPRQSEVGRRLTMQSVSDLTKVWCTRNVCETICCHNFGSMHPNWRVQGANYSSHGPKSRTCGDLDVTFQGSSNISYPSHSLQKQDVRIDWT